MLLLKKKEIEEHYCNIKVINASQQMPHHCYCYWKTNRKQYVLNAHSEGNFAWKKTVNIWAEKTLFEILECFIIHTLWK